MSTSGSSSTASGENSLSRPVDATLNDDQAYFRIQLERNSDATFKISLITEFSAEGLKALEPYMKVRWGGKEYTFRPTSDPRVFDIPELASINGAEHSDFEIYLKDKNENSRTLYRGLSLEEVSRPSVHEIKVLANTGELPPVILDPRSIKRAKVGGSTVGGLNLRTDLHSHLAAIPTGLELLSIATDGGSRPFYYPVRLLTDVRVGIKSDELEQYRGKPSTSHSEYPVRMTLDEVKSVKKSGIDRETKGIANQEVMDTAKPDEEFIDINSLTPEHREKLLKWLSIPPTTQITFDDMEKYYDYREPFTKNLDFFEDILEVAAKNFNKAGVTHASLSFSKRSISPEWFAVLDRVLPRLEREYGVTMRFLVGMTRLLTEDAQRDTVEEFKRVAHHPYIEGMDVFGSEINSTWAFYHVLADLAKWCAENNLSHKVMRIHAGETTYHPENVGAAMRLAKEQNIQVRIGHGLFGSSDDKSLMDYYTKNNLAQKVTIEVNPDSNYALNHIDSLQSYQMADLARSGVRIVLGSDGHGLYLTDAKQLSETLTRMDLQAPQKGARTQHEFTRVSDLVRDSEELEIRKINMAMRKDETEFKKQFRKFITDQLGALTGDERHRAELLLRSLDTNPAAPASSSSSSTLSDDVANIRQEWVQRFVRHQAILMPIYTRSKAYNPERLQASKREKAEREQRLVEKFDDIGAQLLESSDELSDVIGDKTPILITGGFESVDDLSLEQLQAVRDSIRKLIEESDPRKVCFITTGTNLGLQKYINTILQIQAKKGRAFDVIGFIAKSAKPDDLSNVSTHAILGYDKWFDMHGYIGEALERYPNLKVVAIGGNMLTRHIIQTCQNVRKKCQIEGKPVGQIYCVNDIAGASQDKAANLEPEFSIAMQEMRPALSSSSRSPRSPRSPSSPSSPSSSSSASSSSGWSAPSSPSSPSSSSDSIQSSIDLSDEMVRKQTLKLHLFNQSNGSMGAVDTADQALFMARYLISKGMAADVEDLAVTLRMFIDSAPELAAEMPIVHDILRLDVQGDLNFLEDFKSNLASLGFELPVVLNNILKQKRYHALVGSLQESTHPVTRMTTVGESAPEGRGGSVDKMRADKVATRAKAEIMSQKSTTKSLRKSVDSLESVKSVSANRQLFEPPKTPPGDRHRPFSLRSADPVSPASSSSGSEGPSSSLPGDAGPSSSSSSSRGRSRRPPNKG